MPPCLPADDTLRITRGDGGSVFVLVKESADQAAAAGYDYAAQMRSSDWERLEDQDPPASGSVAATVVAEAVVLEAQAEGGAAAAAAVEVVEVIEPEVDSGSGNGNGTAAP